LDMISPEYVISPLWFLYYFFLFLFSFSILDDKARTRIFAYRD
jgi:hypothetical protein